MKYFYLVLFTALFNTANAQCTWYTQISCAKFGDHTLAIKNDGTLWAWGKNSDGQLGDGSTTDRTTPVQISPGSKWISVAAGSTHSLAIKDDGTLWGWGRNGYSELSNIGLINNAPKLLSAAGNWVSVVTGRTHSMALKSDGTIWSWGSNTYGQIGDGTTTSRNNPTQTGTAANWVFIAIGQDYSMGIKSDGTLWGWGWNDYGQLGIGTNTNISSPVQIGTETNWASVDPGILHVVGRKTNGNLWAWGRNSNGQLGDGSQTSKWSPVQIGSDSWAMVTAGYNFSAGIKDDGSLWTWGINNVGQLGDGSTTDRKNLTQIGAANTWALVNAGMFFSTAIQTDAFSYGWGKNDVGQVGDGSTVNWIRPILTGTPPGFTLPAVNSSITNTQQNFTIYNNNCSLIASVLKQGGNTAISGSTTAKVWLENNQAAAFVKRHYEIQPAVNATTATGRVTLYFTQQEFTDFNAVNDVKLPTDATDAANNKANLKIERITGTSSDGTGLPVTYSGTSTTIDPADANILWNAINGFWEVTFSTTGFGAFFVKTQPENLVIPLDKTGLTRSTPAAVAYSLRLLSTTYPGAAIRVRRANDNATQDIGFAADGFLDVAALKSFVGAGNGYVTRWYDQSGSGNDAKQNDNSKQPIIVRAGVVEKVNSLPAIYFGTANMATEKLVIFTKAASMAGVAKGNNAAPATFVSKTGTAAGNNLNYPGPFDFTNSGAEFTAGNAATTAYNLIQGGVTSPKTIINDQIPLARYSFVIPASGTFYTYVNGAQTGSQTVTGFGDGGHSMMLGNRNDGGGSGYFWTSEIVLFNLALSATERQTIENAQIILPLEWLSVKGQLTNNNTARITWQVDEQYVKNYEIEKSTDGIAWTTIGQVASTGNGVHSYSFTEGQELSGAAYYRIKQTDLDGRFTHSTVITLNSDKTESAVTVYPNPAQDVVTVTTGVGLLNTVATLYNANGTALQSLTIRSSSFTINLGSYSAGLYFLRTANGKTLRIIKSTRH